jgi:hypothetical protein
VTEVFEADRSCSNPDRGMNINAHFSVLIPITDPLQLAVPPSMEFYGVSARCVALELILMQTSKLPESENSTGRTMRNELLTKDNRFIYVTMKVCVNGPLPSLKYFYQTLSKLSTSNTSILICLTISL